MTTSVHVLPILSTDQCADIVTEVDRLREHWLPFGSNPKFPYFHTLGAALYLHEKNLATYQARTEVLNPILRKSFKNLHDSLFDVLSKFLKEPIELNPNVGLPGFHIYEVSMPNGGSIHVDLQHRLLSLPDPENWEEEKSLSFTLPVSLPATGSGLNLWKMKFNLMDPTNSSMQIEDLRKQKKPDRFLPYELGQLTLIDSLNVHQIASNPNVDKSNRRITLQGHLLRHRKGSWLAHW